MRRLLPLLLLPLLLLPLFAASAQAKAVLGIADQKASTFADPRLGALKLRYARVYMSWDVLQDKHTRREIDEWFAGARAAGMEPLVTISRSRIPSRISVKPTPARLAAEFRKWRTRWPGQVNRISTWNEANLGIRPELAASWWLALRRACPTCTVLGADLLDDPKVLDWAARFVKAAGRSPAIWGLHAYNDANTFKTTVTKALLKGLKGDFWLTETGGVATRPRPTYKFTGCGVRHQTKATSYLLKSIAKLSPRIKRIYIFNWGLGDNDASFDSALIDAENRERPALNVIRRYLGQPTVAAPFGGFSPGPKRCKRGTKLVKTPKKPATKTGAKAAPKPKSRAQAR